MKDKYLTIAQAAEAVGVARQTVSRWVAKGKIPSEKVGREVLIEKDALFKYRPLKIPDVLMEMGRSMFNSVIDEIRETYGYSPNDKIVLVKGRGNLSKYNRAVFTFAITKDGTDINEYVSATISEVDYREGVASYNIGLAKIEKGKEPET